MELLAKQAKDRPASAYEVMERLRRIPLNEETKVIAPVSDYAPAEDAESLPDDPFETQEPPIPANGWFATTLLLIAFGVGICYFLFR